VGAQLGDQGLTGIHPDADLIPVIETTIRWTAILVSAVVLVSFGLFAIDQTREASTETRAEIAATNRANDSGAQAVADKAKERTSDHSEVRNTIDDVNDAIVSPFEGLVTSDNIWVERTVPSLLALLLFGVGLGFLARFMKGRA
jgi:hypothetical protein